MTIDSLLTEQEAAEDGARHIAEEEEGEVRYLEDKEATIDSMTLRPKHAAMTISCIVTIILVRNVTWNLCMDLNIDKTAVIGLGIFFLFWSLLLILLP